VGWLFNIVLVFCMGDPAEILQSPIAQPVAQIFFNVMGKGPAIFFTVAAFIIMNFVCITALQAGSRTIWAFSRDEMIPGYQLWYKIWRRTNTPVLAVWLYTLICILINLIGLGSYVTISAIFNTCAIALDWSYCIPILCKLFFGRFRRGPWHLGRASVFINVWACVWTAFVSVIFLFPTFMPVQADTVSIFRPLTACRRALCGQAENAMGKLMEGQQMNYAAVILVFVFLLATAYWFIRGHKYYTGPRTRAHVVDGHIVQDERAELADQEKATAGFHPAELPAEKAE